MTVMRCRAASRDATRRIMAGAPIHRVYRVPSATPPITKWPHVPLRYGAAKSTRQLLATAVLTDAHSGRNFIQHDSI